MNKTSQRNQLRLALIGLGIFLGICGWSMFNQGYKSVYGIDRWLQIDAIVVESKIETVSMHNQSSNGPSSITGWKPSIVNSHPIGTTCTIYVNPDNPSDVILSRSDKKPSKVLIIVGSLLAIVSIGMLILGALFPWCLKRCSSG